jgi:hypothetical protein
MLKKNSVFQHSSLHIQAEVYKGERVEVRKVSNDLYLLVIKRTYRFGGAMGDTYELWKFVKKGEVKQYV